MNFHGRGGPLYNAVISQRKEVFLLPKSKLSLKN